MTVSVTHNAADQEFTLVRDGYTAELAYSFPEQEVIDFTHTFVDEELRGQGLAEELARAGLAYARQQHLKVQTSCQFMRHFMEQHPEYHELRAQKA
ncbi:N-acetyltransferase [Hymenobacter sp. HSC-4F20]|uniref:GNAT family N-acetyltransferase n=1 Tax=Hymenobacter sp. HSC-4F20 TaxID=2864135 RepID=UPI001C7395B7|nr:GNAT family N-acetyltransferase [Hymenobacter sp. HSC-4F20]MBX0290486.1 N-acetyltransferase [Hymenobacter sp. HSC-4F20]